MCLLRRCVEVKNAKNGNMVTLERQPGFTRPVGFGRRLDPALKAWLDNVIIPALVREYLAEIEKQNRLATTGVSELPSD